MSGCDAVTVEGIDVSVYQTTTPPLTGLGFLFARASIGVRKDARYDQHIANARARGLVTGAYHFGDNRLTAASQAATFLQAAGDVDFYFLDVEGGHAMGSAAIRTFFAQVRKAGKKIGLYHSLSGFPELGQDYNWVAYWSGVPPSINWTFWQYRGSPLDLDRFIGSMAQLRALTKPTAPDPGEPHYRAVVKTPTQLWNDKTKRWVYKTRPIKPGTVFTVRGKQFQKGPDQTDCYAVVGGPYYLPQVAVKQPLVRI